MWAGAILSVLVAPLWLSEPVGAGDGASSELPAALSAGNPTGPLITPVQAVEVIEAFWPLREKALAGDDIEMTNRLEDGVAREFDNAVSAFDRHIPARSRLRRIRSHGPVTAFVPRQTTYPARFLAAVPTSVYATVEGESVAGAPYVELLVMTRRDAGARWMLSFDTGYQGTAPLVAPVEGDGFTIDVPSPGWTDVKSLHPLLADYLQHWKEHGSAPPDNPFLPGYWTTERGPRLTPQDGYSSRCQCFEHTDYHVDHDRDELFEFAVRSTPAGPPVNLVCSTVRIHDVWRPRAGRVLHQNGDRTNWGGGLRPGVYHSLTSDAVRQTCIAAGATRTAGLEVIGGNGDWVRTSGERAGAFSVLGSRVRVALPFLLASALAYAALILVAVIVVRSRRPAPTAPWPPDSRYPPPWPEPPPTWPPPPPADRPPPL